MELYPNREQARTYAHSGEYRAVPLSYTQKCTLTATEIYSRLKNISRNVFILDSAEENTHGKYTFLGYDPKLEITCRDGVVRVRGGTELTFQNADPKEHIRRVLAENKSPKIDGLPYFTGGLVGYFAFDSIKYSEPQMNFDIQDEEDFRDIDLMLFDKVIAIDNEKKEIIYIVNIKTEDFDTAYNKAVLDVEGMVRTVTRGEPKLEEKGRLLSELTPLFDKEAYCKKVQHARH